MSLSSLRPLLSSLTGLALAGAGTLLGGCQYLPSIPTPDWNADRFLGVVTPYKIEIVQGNVITSEQAEAVKPGMNRAQVRDVLGSPLIADPFHADRWDYVFTIRRQGAEPQSRRVVVVFDGDIFKRLDTGGALPSERDFVASIDTFKTSRNAPPLELTPEQLKALPAPAKTEVDPAEPVGPTRPYPPLEPNS
ncbi:MAG: outer membrane protein assembly factor BamE [Pseudomonadota bacterium]|nr:outer membrane protein assembly factor BamE [Pseudomonadota bacterium]